MPTSFTSAINESSKTVKNVFPFIQSKCTPELVAENAFIL